VPHNSVISSNSSSRQTLLAAIRSFSEVLALRAGVLATGDVKGD
jgi:hypothetical protein